MVSEEMPQRLKIHATLAEDLSSVLNTTPGSSQLPVTSTPGDPIAPRDTYTHN